MYLILFALVMAGLGGAFMTIKIRQQAVIAKERLVNKQMAKAKDSIKQFEQLQEKRKAMMKTALTTAELLEPVPRSVLLAAITNNLPSGVSLLKLEAEKKETKHQSRKVSARTSKYQQAQASRNIEIDVSPENTCITNISIEGVAPSDLQVASYIENLGCSALLDNVALVESKEQKDDESRFRQFKLTAKLALDVHLTKEDISIIKAKCKKSTYKF
jgi:Tfp pilus assembly protein PilN